MTYDGYEITDPKHPDYQLEHRADDARKTAKEGAE